MQFLSTILLVAALAVGIAEAKPSATVPLAARNGPSKTSKDDCGSSEFFYEQRSCCLPHGGPTSTPKPPSGIDCPSAWYFEHQQGCCVPNHPPTSTATPTCGMGGWFWSTGMQCCTPEPSKPTHTPTPSAKPKAKTGSYGKAKRNFQWDETMCPSTLTNCPIKVDGVFTGDSECIDKSSDLTSCGGCSSVDESFDCSKNVKSSSCMAGVCNISECKSGFKLSADRKACVSA